jgi:hypothetical protein
MISLSLSLTSDKVWDCIAIVGERRYRPAFTHPLNAEYALDNEAYRAWLWEQLQSRYTQTFKDALWLIRQHQAGKQVVLRLHQNSQHGNILLATLLFMSDRYPADEKPKYQPGHAHLPSVPEEMEEEAEMLQPDRFVWIMAKDGSHAKLGYVYDTVGVITALVPGFGLVKLGRIQETIEYAEPDNEGKKVIRQVVANYTFWQKRRQLTDFLPRVHVANCSDAGRNEDVFARLLAEQRKKEKVEIKTLEDPERYDKWDLVEMENAPEEPEPLEEIHAAEHAAFMAFHTIVRTDFNAFLPTKFYGEHVRPVYKTRPDGSVWVLSAEKQSRGVLHLYERIK